ncbi:hypothetical protein, partial [Lysobacter sp. TAB13]|uniref:hypothetical protein n=1 Tax=Lysobacter sp. TAB13 TaxID=3233065 RepID=UPI003F994442
RQGLYPKTPQPLVAAFFFARGKLTTTGHFARVTSVVPVTSGVNSRAELIDYRRAWRFLRIR